MRVLAFCGSIANARRIVEAFAGSDHELSIVICNHQSGRAARFYASFLYRLARSPRFALQLLGRCLVRSCLVTYHPIESRRIMAFIASRKPDLALHALGVIYRASTIAACGLGILNPHIGELPRYRGRSVMEWSLLCGDRTGVAVFFIDTGIDTGERIVLFEPVSVESFPDLDTAKGHLFAQDARLFRRAVELIAAHTSFISNDVDQGARFYEMSSLFREVLQRHRAGV